MLKDHNALVFMDVLHSLLCNKITFTVTVKHENFSRKVTAMQ
jgi:hypothetical protein